MRTARGVGPVFSKELHQLLHAAQTTPHLAVVIAATDFIPSHAFGGAAGKHRRLHPELAIVLLGEAERNAIEQRVVEV